MQTLIVFGDVFALIAGVSAGILSVHFTTSRFARGEQDSKWFASPRRAVLLSTFVLGQALFGYLFLTVLETPLEIFLAGAGAGASFVASLKLGKMRKQRGD